MDDILDLIGDLQKLRLKVNPRNVNTPTSDGNSLLIHAASSGNIDVVNFLVRFGANVNFENRDGNTALLYAVFNNHSSVVDKLLKEKAVINSTVIDYAIENNSYDSFKLLLEHNAEVNLEHLRRIIARERNDFLILLKNNGTDFDAIDWVQFDDIMQESTRNLISGKNYYPEYEIVEPYQIYDYQVDGHLWMKDLERENVRDRYGVRGGIIRMDMGLGKSLLALYHIFNQQQENNESFPTLVISSKTVMGEWKSSGIEKFYPDANVLWFHRDYISGLVDTITAKQLREYSIVFTTYDVVKMYYASLNKTRFNVIDQHVEFGKPGPTGVPKILQIDIRKKPQYNETDISAKAIYYMPWERIICDESQMFANPTTIAYQSIMGLYSKWRFGLTGTPIRNYELDIWSQLRFCGFDGVPRPTKWNREQFDDWTLSRFIYSKNYADVKVVIPDKIEHIYRVKMTDHQSREPYFQYLHIFLPL